MLLALWVPKLRGQNGDMLVHHVATLTLATLGAGYGYLEHLAPFFFGLTELSSVSAKTMRWSLVASRWSLVAGRWSLAAGRWS